MVNSDLSRAITLLEKRSKNLHRKVVSHPSAKKFFRKSNLVAHDLRQKSSRLLAGAGLVGALLASPVTSLSSIPAQETSQSTNTISERQKLLGALQEVLPHQPTRLTSDQAQQIESIIKTSTNIEAKAVLEDQSLNHHVGYIGYEQHLKRFPGDSINQHDSLQDAGMAPGLGAFGYFSPDSQSFTTKDYSREKYYCVVQTLYLENWNRDFKFLKDWYKFRKMLVVNPDNGQAVVCAVGDAGPAEWTGKQFGGSPETMEYLDLNKGPRKGLVLMLFVDDPNDKIPLGPVNY